MLSGEFTIGPDSTLYLSSTGASGGRSHIEELRLFLTNSSALRAPTRGLHPPVGYRPVRVYVGGECRPGYYTITVLSWFKTWPLTISSKVWGEQQRRSRTRLLRCRR